MIDLPSQPGFPSPRLTIVIVNYNAWPEVDALVASLASEPEVVVGKACVVVVDNGSAPPIPSRLDPPPPGVALVEQRDNTGFARGVNAGWQTAPAPWILLLNPDVEVAPGFLAQVVSRIAELEADSASRSGIVGFALRNHDGTRQPSVGAEPTLGRVFWEWLLPRSRRKYLPEHRLHAGEVPWVTGACMLVRGEIFDALGGFDGDFFLYYEEVAFCRAAARLGWRVAYDPSIEVVHLHPLQNRGVSPRLRVITRHSKLLYFRKHRPRWEFRLLRRIVGLEAAARRLLATLRGREVDRRVWSAVARIARDQAGSPRLKGLDIRDLAIEAETGCPVHNSTSTPHSRGPRAGQSALDRSARIR